MAKNVSVVNLNDFTGGLNLRADAFQLADNESPDLMNVDVDPRGGFRQRRVVSPLNTAALSGVPKNIWQFTTTAGTKQILVALGTTLHFSTGGNFTSLGVTQTAVHATRAVTFKDSNYVQNGVDQPLRWNGTTGTRLAQSWNNNLLSPNQGDMPTGKCIASHQGSVWVANTVEGGTPFRNRVRFSHPNQPEDWRDFDFIDVDTGRDGDEITALVPWGDRLLVFKRNSVHAIFGYSPDTFQVFPVSQVVGAPSQEAVVATEAGVYFFSWPEGVFFFDGRGIRWLFERLFPAITDGTIPDAHQDKIVLGWGGRRLWVSVPYENSTQNAHTFVFDPTLGKVGAWVQYGFGVGPMLEWQPAGSDSLFLACAVATNFVLKLEQDGAQDDFGNGGVHVDSWFRTKWVDLDQPAQKKRWRAPDVVCMAGTEAEFFAEALADYDATTSSKHFRLNTVADGSALVWDSGQWDVGEWGRAAADRNSVEKGAPLGSARAVSLMFRGPLTDAKWGVDAIAFKFVPKKIRS